MTWKIDIKITAVSRDERKKARLGKIIKGTSPVLIILSFLKPEAYLASILLLKILAVELQFKRKA